MALSKVAQSGNVLATLEAMRDAIAADLDTCEATRDKAALYLRMADVLVRIEQIRPEPARGDAVDEVAARRSARRASASKSAARSKRQG